MFIIRLFLFFNIIFKAVNRHIDHKYYKKKLKNKPKIIDEIATNKDWIADVLKSFGYKANFSIESLKEIDRFIDEQIQPGGLLYEQTGQRLFALGAYIGETFIKNFGGKWITNDKDPLGLLNIAVELPNNVTCWPVQKVAKRCKNGRKENIYYYGIFADPKSRYESESDPDFFIDRVARTNTMKKLSEEDASADILEEIDNEDTEEAVEESDNITLEILCARIEFQNPKSFYDTEYHLAAEVDALYADYSFVESTERMPYASIVFNTSSSLTNELEDQKITLYNCYGLKSIRKVATKNDLFKYAILGASPTKYIEVSYMDYTAQGDDSDGGKIFYEIALEIDKNKFTEQQIQGFKKEYHSIINSIKFVD